MKILLTTSPRRNIDIPIYPLGLSYLADVLSKDHRVDSIDVCIVKDPNLAVRDKIESFQPDIVGVSLTYLDTACSYDNFSYFPLFKQYISKIKNISSKALIVVGGAGFSLMPRQIMEAVPQIDLGVYLQGEETIPKLLLDLSHPESVKGVWYRSNGRILFSGLPQPVDFSNSGCIPRKFFNVSSYTNIPGQIGVQTKRGCSFNCIYCNYPVLEGKRLRLRTAKEVVDEVEALCDLGIKDIMFSDSVFNCPKVHAEEICQEIINRNIHLNWRAFFSEKYIDRSFVRLALSSGCKLFILGTDAATDRDLIYLNKPFNLIQVKRAYESLAGEGAKFYSGFMWNYPGTNLKTLWQIIKLTYRYVISGNLLFCLSTIRIYPNTKIYRLAKQNGVIKEGENLISPVYYNPWPLLLLSSVFDIGQNLLHSAKNRLEYLWRKFYL